MIEKQIGKKIREIRKKQGISQMALAEKLGLSFQQIQKYEKGISKISVSRLFQIADALNVSILAFFEEDQQYMMENAEKYALELSREEKELVKLFKKINNKKIKNGILLMLKGISEEEEE